MDSTVIVNIGKLVSGDYRTGLLDADTVLIRDGKIAEIGKRADMDITGVDHVVDVKGLILSPGLIDAHTHPVIGDWHPRHNVIGWMDGALHGGTVFLEKGLTKADFEELAREGVGVVAEIGGTGLFEYDDVKEYVDWAREVGMIVPMHFAGRSVPGSARLYADEVLALQPDVVVHINGGPTSAPVHEAERLIDGTKAYLEVICNGNYRTMYDFVLLMKERDQLHRVLIGTDSPVGAGIMPMGIIRTVQFVSSMCEIPAEKVLAMATGSVADAYRLNTGKVEVGRDADLIAIDAPLDCYASDGLGCIELGDVPAIRMIMVDGEVIALRARNTTFSDVEVSVDGREATYNTRENTLFSAISGRAPARKDAHCARFGGSVLNSTPPMKKKGRIPRDGLGPLRGRWASWAAERGGSNDGRDFSAGMGGSHLGLPADQLSGFRAGRAAPGRGYRAIRFPRRGGKHLGLPLGGGDRGSAGCGRSPSSGRPSTRWIPCGKRTAISSSSAGSGSTSIGFSAGSRTMPSSSRAWASRSAG